MDIDIPKRVAAIKARDIDYLVNHKEEFANDFYNYWVMGYLSAIFEKQVDERNVDWHKWANFWVTYIRDDKLGKKLEAEGLTGHQINYFCQAVDDWLLQKSMDNLRRSRL